MNFSVITTTNTNVNIKVRKFLTVGYFLTPQLIINLMFAKMLRELRIEKGHSQSELANALNATKQNISDWENEKCETSFEMLIKIANLFNVTVGQLLGSEEY
ncbi:MAG: helix-turn-helix domain-containing protein [Firmicutes bacterium]|nr:helix-turn-helix domain-containing protein [Bacillota bacterium]